MKTGKFSLKPVLSLFALIAIAHLPLGAPHSASFLIPSIIMALVFIWSVTEPDNVKPWMIFMLGVVADVISSGPIGFWALYYLSAQAIGSWFAHNPANSGLLVSWVEFLFTAFVVTLLTWVVTTVYTMQYADWSPMLLGASVVSICYPVIYWLSGARRLPASSMAIEHG